MPIEHSATSLRPGMGGGVSGFSTKLRMRKSPSTAITPKPLASATGTSRQPTVTSACRVTCAASIGP
jgi:hypothetical protein